MKIVYEPRASTILYNLLAGRSDKRPILLPANICPIVPITFLKANAPFEFIDISPVDLQMDLYAARDRLKAANYGGVLYAHTYGEESTPEDFFADVKAMDPSVLLIDDRCLCDPETSPRLTAADAVLFSTGMSKVVDLGFGGYGFLDEALDYLHKHLTFIKGDYAILEKDYKSVIAGQTRYEYRDSDWLQTEANLPVWEKYIQQVSEVLTRADAHRRSINAIYSDRLPPEIQLPAKYQGWRFNILASEPKHLIDAIFGAGLFASSHYASLDGIFSDDRNCLQAATLAGKVINLFSDYHYSIEMAEKTCEVCLTHL